MTSSYQNILSHLIELRRRAVRVLLSYTGLFFIFFFLASDLFYFIVKPLVQILPAQSHLIATQITAPVFTPVKMACNAALLMTIPLVLYQLWCFIAPGLYLKERKNLRLFILLSLCLFMAGVIFCYCLILPYMFRFFAEMLPQEVVLLPDMSYSVDFIFHMLILFGLSFQVPVACMALTQLGVLKPEQLKTFRPYIIVASFTVGMLLTPPDVLSQILLAVPLCLLYELGIFMSSFFSRHTPKKVKT